MLAVSELKQFAYCPRIFYFIAVQPLRPPATRLMDRGRDLQREFERLEPRRVLSRYGLEQARRHFSITLTDPGLSLTGQADLVLEAKDRLAVVEFKASAAALAENHRLQLGAYALLAERVFNRPCPTGFALFVDREELEEVAINEELRLALLETLAGMRALLQAQGFPPPTPVRARCTNCEFRNFCGDIF
jgi:CRISPR-associated exonuclease Cas4